MRRMIEAALIPLLGLPMRDMGRAADMAWLGFGDEIEVPDTRTGATRTLARYRLHLSCPFRLSGPGGAIAAAHDMYHARVNPGHEPDSFEWDRPRATWYDARVEEFVARLEAEPILVEGVAADDFGGFRIALSAGHALEVFPTTSYPQEHWRFFDQSDDGPHFVVFDDDSE